MTASAAFSAGIAICSSSSIRTPLARSPSRLAVFDSTPLASRSLVANMATRFGGRSQVNRRRGSHRFFARCWRKIRAGWRGISTRSPDGSPLGWLPHGWGPRRWRAPRALTSFRDADPQWRVQEQPFRRYIGDAWSVVTQSDVVDGPLSADAACVLGITLLDGSNRRRADHPLAARKDDAAQAGVVDARNRRRPVRERRQRLSASSGAARVRTPPRPDFPTSRLRSVASCVSRPAFHVGANGDWTPGHGRPWLRPRATSPTNRTMARSDGLFSGDDGHLERIATAGQSPSTRRIVCCGASARPFARRSRQRLVAQVDSRHVGAGAPGTREERRALRDEVLPNRQSFRRWVVRPGDLAVTRLGGAELHRRPHRRRARAFVGRAPLVLSPGLDAAVAS